MQEELFAPTGTVDTSLSLKRSDDLARRLVPITMRDDSPDALPPRDIEQIAEICAEVDFLAGGAFSTAYDQFRFAEMLRLDGKLDGVRVPSPAVIKVATIIQSGNKLHGRFMGAAERYQTDPFPAYIALSIYVRAEGIFVTNMGTLSSPRTLRIRIWGQPFCIDTERDLTIVHPVCGCCNYTMRVSARGALSISFSRPSATKRCTRSGLEEVSPSRLQDGGLDGEL
ncbi:hypothetical protein GWG65_31150 [Bradyrhizobium sp. CSA207]|uniref:hypothetical protein n=1 Tax=Bradyrhizobium sp. CSA207 TaxID=2698826 RepID=UPI0023AFD1B6|nr:hypothetical protein [Bradyrhizobium sp. CSA207]MDE5445788.1 hypothetical protein [Bradyrhizobium sp. CSA207]